MFKIKFLTSITIMLCLLTSIAFADTKLPKHYPLSFEISGTITNIYKKRRIIVLDKADYSVHPVYDIYTLRNKSKTTLYSLKPGMKIGGKFSVYNGKRVLTEIWILPKNYPTQPHAL